MNEQKNKLLNQTHMTPNSVYILKEEGLFLNFI